MDLLERFLELEKRHDLFTLSYNGVFFWHLIRTPTFIKIQRGKPVEDFPDSKKSQDLLPFARKNLVQSSMSLFSRRKYDILLSATLSLRNIDGKQMNPYVDITKMHFENQWSFNKNIQYFIDLQPLERGEHDSSFQILTMHYYARWINRKVRQGTLKVLPEVKQLSEWIYESFAFSIKPELLMSTIYKSVMAFRLYRAYYKFILSGRYRMVYLSCHYDIYQFAMIAAAKECGIPSVEHQHGAIGRLHIAYNFSDCRPTGKYLPNYLLTYGDYWSQTCRLPQNCQTVAVGDLLFEKSVQNYRFLTQDERTVVFYSGGHVQQDMSCLAIEFAQKYAKNGWKIIFKLHPGECRTWKERIPELSQCVEIQVIDELINVHHILATCKHHVGIDTTVLFEAVAFEGHVYVWNHPPLSDYVMELVEKGCARRFNNADELYQLLNSPADRNLSTVARTLYTDRCTEKFCLFFEKLMPTN